MRRAEQMRWLVEHQSSGGSAFASGRSRAPRTTAVLLLLLAAHTLSWVGCGGEDDRASAPVGGGNGDRDGGLDAGDGGGDAADAAPDADDDFGFEELGVPDAAADSGADSRVPELPDEFACGQARWGDGAHCDCGCLVQDPDCDDGEGCTEASCEAAGCDVRHDDTGAAIKPASYTCDDATFDSLDGCDCGCGAIDPDCIG